MRIPPELGHLRGEPGGAAWLERLPALVSECAELWSLRLGEAYHYAYVSVALRAELADGTAAVLKVGFPHRESAQEADALAHYDGRGAVRLLAHDRERNALLLERCEPGTALEELENERGALRIAAGVLARLWRPPVTLHVFRPIAVDAARWAEILPERWDRLGKPFARELLDEAVGAFHELPPTQGELVVCHQDLHLGNILRARREPWLAIDPKPVLAEREFDLVALLRHGAASDLRRRLDFLAAELGLDRERARRWALAHKLAWSFDDSAAEPDDLDVVRRLLRAAK